MVVTNPSFKLQRSPFPIDTGWKLDVHKTFRSLSRRPLNILYTFNLHIVSRGLHQARNKVFR